MIRAEDPAGTRLRDVVISAKALGQAPPVLAVAGPTASPARASAVHRRLRFARFLVGVDRVGDSDAGDRRSDPPRPQTRCAPAPRGRRPDSRKEDAHGRRPS